MAALFHIFSVRRIVPESNSPLETTLHELLEAFGCAPLHETTVAIALEGYEADCPICRLVTRSVERSLKVFFAEFVNDPKTREGLRRAQGFCAEHIPLLAASGDALAIAIIYADLARLAGERWSEGERGGIRFLRRARQTLPTSPCPACVAALDSVERYSTSLAAGLEKAEVWATVEAGTGLCVAHVDRVLLHASPAAATRLRKLEMARVAALQTELEEIIRKNDYRFRGEPWGPEKDAWLRALRKITRSG